MSIDNEVITAILRGLVIAVIPGCFFTLSFAMGSVSAWGKIDPSLVKDKAYGNVLLLINTPIVSLFIYQLITDGCHQGGTCLEYSFMWAIASSLMVAIILGSLMIYLIKKGYISPIF